MLRKSIFLLLALILCGCNVSTATEPPVSTTEDTTIAETYAPTEETSTAAPQPSFDPYTIIDTMSPEELVGQLFLARCPDKTQAMQDISTYHFGGYILFSKDFETETPASVQETIAAYQAAATIPLLMAVDEEGGSVTRISCHPQFRTERFPSPRQAIMDGGLENALDLEAEKADLLSSLGINVNFAPVCDITTDPSAFMYSRSLGLEPDATGQYVKEAANIMASYGIGAVVKHFPGYGNNTDTHVGIAVDTRALETLESCDLVPFQTAIDSGCNAILVSHTIIQCLDDRLPASLSPGVITYLRRVMGFSGVVVTDDLVMDAITDHYGAGESAIMAIAAGCDLLCSSEYDVQYQAVLDALQNGRLSRQRVEQAAARILQWKYDLGLLEKNVQ